MVHRALRFSVVRVGFCLWIMTHSFRHGGWGVADPVVVVVILIDNARKKFPHKGLLKMFLSQPSPSKGQNRYTNS